MNLTVLAPIGSLLALLFAGYFSWKILKLDEGTDRMKEIAKSIRIGAKAYLIRQYKGVAIFFVGMFILLLILSKFEYVSVFVPYAFLTGGFFSGLSGFLGMKIATSSNARTTHACTKSLNRGLRVAFSSGAVMGLVVVGFGLLDLSIWYYILDWYYRAFPEAEIGRASCRERVWQYV